VDADDFWPAVFGRRGAVEIEIGAGRGHFLFAAVVTRPAHNFLAIEASTSRARWLAGEAVARGLTNVRILRADAGCVVATLIPDASVDAYHIYFPDPWWKRRHHRRRLFTPAFAGALARTLRAGGAAHVATDVPAYYDTICALLSPHLERETAADRSVVTRFEHKARLRGAPVYAVTFRK
jgi:tRNA (guanine-N7-)-methyltransferase